MVGSYLSDRFQQECLSGKYSEAQDIKSGMLQGSVLGPFLFTVYINDLPLHLSHFISDMFADDTTITAFGHSIYSIL
jgi:hypothetical protein